MNPSLQRYVEFRKLMIRQAKAQRARGAVGAANTAHEARAARESALIERSNLLERAAAQAEAMRWTLRAVRAQGNA
jgi:molybdopterin/thiamine biosynthesis adenylyltransferase